jgi:hypothetical protein
MADAWYLRNISSGSTFVNIPEITILSTTGNYFEYSGFALAGNGNNTYRLLGQSTGFNSLVEMTTTTIVTRFDNVSGTVSNNYTQPAFNQDFILRIERSSSAWIVTLDGQTIGTINTNNNFKLSQLMCLNSQFNLSFRGAMYYVEIGTSAGVTNFYDPTLSGGTGTVLTD